MKRLVRLHRRVAGDVDGDHLRGLAGGEGHAAAGQHAAGEVGRVGRIRAAAGDRVVDARRAAGVALRVTVKVNGVLPELPSALLASVAAMASVGGGSVSSLMIVPVAVAVVIVPPIGPESVTVKPSFGSTVVSPLTLTVITFEVSPAAKVTRAAGQHAAGEVGRIGRIGAAAGHRVVRRSIAPLVSPLRVTVKVNGRAAGVAFRLAGVGGRDGQRRQRHVSSLMIVPVAVAVLIVPPDRAGQRDREAPRSAPPSCRR